MSRGGGGRTARRWRAAVAVLAGALLLVAMQSSARADDPLAEALRRKQDIERAVQVSRANVQRHREAASRFEAAVVAANARIADLAVRQRSAQSEADSLAIDIQIAEEQLQLVAFQLGETNALAQTLAAQAAASGRLLAAREAAYAAHLRATYRHAQVSPLEMLLSSSSVSEFAARVQAMIHIDRTDAQLAGEIRSLRTLIAAREEAAAAKADEIEGLQEQINRQRAGLASTKAQYDELVRQAQASIQSQAAERARAASAAGQARSSERASEAETASLNRQLELAEASYARLAAELAARSALAAFKGAKLGAWPLRGPITSGFGPRWGGFHNGIDIAAPMYTPVVSAAAGQVVAVGRPYATAGDTAVVVIVAHGTNFSTLYGHLDDRRWPPVALGQFVVGGQVIGYVGMTGRTTGPHLHFMTTMNGVVGDPLLYLP